MLTTTHTLDITEAEAIKRAVLDAAVAHGVVLDPERLARELIAAFAVVDAATEPAACSAA